MINKPTLAVVAALLAGSTPGAFAAVMDNDANTGLSTYQYYGTIADLKAQGLPISANAAKYVGQRHVAPAQSNRDGVYLLEDTRGITGSNSLFAEHNRDDKHRPW